MWEIIAGAAAGVIGVVVAWVGIGVGSGYFVLDPYEERRRLQREHRRETDAVREERLAYGLKKSLSGADIVVDEKYVDVNEADKDMIEHEADLGLGLDLDRDEIGASAGAGAGAGAGVATAGGGFFGRKRELVNMSVMP